jgi:hypothetical protein
MFYLSKSCNQYNFFKLKNSFSTTTQTSVKTASKRLDYFFRRGKKAATETKRRARFIKHARTKSNRNIREENALHSSFKSFFIHATPFIGLKTRRLRRGKRVLNKVITLTRSRSQSKSFLEFTSTVSVAGRSTKPFRVRLKNELETLHFNTFKENTISQTSGTSLYEKRALLYSTAYTAMGSARTIKSKNKILK